MPRDENVKPSEMLKKIHLRKITKADLLEVWGIIQECAQDLANQGLSHWKDHYSLEMMEKIILHKEVYLAEANGQPVGTMTFDARPPKYYQEEGYDKMFQDPQAPSGYVMAMGVRPGFQGQGIAGAMLTFAEQEALKRGLEWLRLDCRDEVPGLVSFYEKRGFVKVGREAMQEGKGETYWLMEKKLDEQLSK